MGGGAEGGGGGFQGSVGDVDGEGGGGGDVEGEEVGAAFTGPGWWGGGERRGGRSHGRVEWSVERGGGPCGEKGRLRIFGEFGKR